MDDSGQRENGRHKTDQYKQVHTQVMKKIYTEISIHLCFLTDHIKVMFQHNLFSPVLFALVLLSLSITMIIA